MKRILLAGLLGGLAVFIWSFIAHMVLPLGEAGVRPLPNEAATLEGLGSSIPEAGMYLFPMMGNPSEASEAEQAKWMEAYRTGPAGVPVYRPLGGEFNFPKLLGVEFLTTFLAALLAAFFLARSVGSYFQRALLVGAFGLFAWFSISVSYWNWYDFPTAFILAEGIDQVVGWLVAGFVIAKLSEPPAMSDFAGGHTVEEHFTGKPPEVRRIYDRLLEVVRGIGPVEEEAKKTSIHIVRSSAIAGVEVRREYILLNIKSDAPIESPRFAKSERLSAKRFHQKLRLSSPREVDADVERWLRGAYELSG